MNSARRKDSGYALLLILLMGAIIAISLYSEIPRVAFQSQRQKEQLLMERGEQYKRAIQVFMQVNRTWPRSLDDLKTFGANRHFLRHEYVDPMTRKAEWRLIHIQGNVLVDSLVNKKPADKQATSSGDSSYISAYAGLGETPTTGGAGMRPQDRRRASEGGAGAPGGMDGQLGAFPPPVSESAGLSPPDTSGTTTPSQPGGQPGTVGATGQQPGMAGMQPGMPGQQPGQPGMPGATAGDNQAQNQGSSYITASPGLGQAPPSQTGVMPGQPMPGQAGGMPGQPNAQGQNPAAALINQILTTPNPRGAPNAPQPPDGQGQQPGGIGQQPGSMIMGGYSQTQNNTFGGGGIAGVASTSKQEGIMVYYDRTAYNEWEFIFDPTKVPRMMPMTSGTPLGGSGSPTTPGQTAQTGQPGQMGGMPGQLGTMMGQPGRMGGMPGQIGGMPGQMGGMPGQIGGMPGQMGGGIMGQMGGIGAGARTGQMGATGAAGMVGIGTGGALPPGFRMGRP